MPIPINISASTGAAILKESRYDTAIRHWLRIMESRNSGFCARNKYDLPVFEENAAIRFGWAFEDAIAELAMEARKTTIENREKFYTKEIHGVTDAITCHIDGICDDGILHEAKTTNYFSWLNNFQKGEEGKPDRIPVEYLIQAQHQMICTGAKKVILSVLVFPKRQQEWEDSGILIDEDYFLYFPDNEKLVSPMDWAITLNQMGFFHQYEIDAEEKLQGIMLERYEKFWRENIIGESMPEFQDMEDIRRIIKDPVGTVILKGDSALLAVEAQQIAREEAVLKKRKEKLKIAICQIAHDEQKKHSVDDDSKDKWIFRDEYGMKLATMTDKRFTWGKGSE